MDVILHHNPRCSKSRATVERLRARGVAPRVIDYLRTPPTRTELEDFIARLGCEARALARKCEAAWQELGLSASANAPSVSDALLAHPIFDRAPERGLWKARRARPTAWRYRCIVRVSARA